MQPLVKRRRPFTLPAEAGQEQLTLQLAQMWGADAIRDSDGTKLSRGIAELDYRIYSTICLVRADQEWAYSQKDQLAQKFLMSQPVTAVEDSLEIDEARPLVDFVASSGMMTGMSTEELAAIGEHLERKLAQENVLRVTKNMGIFAARQPL